MVNFAHAVIYRIINKETFETLYVGSTTDYNRRIRKHKSCCNNPNAREHNYPIYKCIRELGGWDAVRHIMVFEYTTCQNNLQLTKLEQEYIQEFNASKNASKAYLTDEQKKEYYKQYNYANKEKIKQYNDAHKEEKKQWHLANRDRRNEQARSRYLKRKNEQPELVQSTIL